MTISRVLAIAAAALLIAAGVAGFSTITTDSGVGCGSWIVRDSSAAEHEDDVNSLAGLGSDGETQESCDKAISDKTPIVLILGGLGIAAGVGAAAATRSRQTV